MRNAKGGLNAVPGSEFRVPGWADATRVSQPGTRNFVHSALRIPHSGLSSLLGFCFAQTRDAVAGLPMTAFLKDFDAFKALEHIAFRARSAGGAQA